jgi:1,2-dihydroxy-3-keto-5-methylthiopentene dioxygenase
VGVLYLHAPSLSEVDALAAERGYKNRDEVKVSPQTMGDAYEDKVRSFFAEHLHEDEEIRYIRGGKGYFDVRNEGDEWVRIELEKDDLIILPPGIYHRFTTDETNVSVTPVQPSVYPRDGGRTLIDTVAHLLIDRCVWLQFVHAMRLFKEEPKWTPLNRSNELDENPHRKGYVSQYLG